MSASPSKERSCHIPGCLRRVVDQRRMQGPDEQKPRMEWLCAVHLTQLDEFLSSGESSRMLSRARVKLAPCILPGASTVTCHQPVGVWPPELGVSFGCPQR